MKIIRRDFLKTAVAAAIAPPLVRLSAAQAAAPSVSFPTVPRERIAVSSYPFREFIAGAHDPHATSSKMPIKEFAAHVRQKFNVTRIEPWSEHFLSLDAAYLDDLKAAVAKAGCGFANIAADGRDSFYSRDPAIRQRAVEFGKRWADVAARIGSPSVRINLPADKQAKPDAALVADSLKTLAAYAASRSVVVHHENDNPVSEDPFFLASVLDRVGSPWERALPDFGNSLAALPPEEAYRGLDLMFARSYGICHVKDPISNDQGVRVPVDLARAFGIAKKHNYQGYYSMEWDTEGDPYAGTAKLIEATLGNLS
jgi:sugar phosphate isomerase/epimerase